MENNVLPDDIDNIVTESLKTIDVYTLWIWLKMRKVKFKYKNRGPFKSLLFAELQELITSAIKEFYYGASNEDEQEPFLFSEMIDPHINIPETYIEYGGIYITKKGSFFEIDFLILLLYTDERQPENIYFKSEVSHYAKSN